MEIEREIRKLTNKEQPCEIKYYPNKTGEELTGWRNILPLSVFSRKGTKYVLAWFVDGSSVSGGAGYRLYYMHNIKDFRSDLSTEKLFPIAYRANIKDSVNIDHLGMMMALRGQVE